MSQWRSDHSPDSARPVPTPPPPPHLRDGASTRAIIRSGEAAGQPTGAESPLMRHLDDGPFTKGQDVWSSIRRPPACGRVRRASRVERLVRRPSDGDRGVPRRRLERNGRARSGPAARLRTPPPLVLAIARQLARVRAPAFALKSRLRGLRVAPGMASGSGRRSCGVTIERRLAELRREPCPPVIFAWM